MDTEFSRCPNNTTVAVRVSKHEIDCDHFFVLVCLAGAWGSCVVPPRPESSRSRGVLWTSNLPFYPMSKPWHQHCVSERPTIGWRMHAKKHQAQFYLRKSVNWTSESLTGVSVLSPVSWSVVAAFLKAKTRKVDPSSPDSAVMLFRVSVRYAAACTRVSCWVALLLVPVYSLMCASRNISVNNHV